MSVARIIILVIAIVAGLGAALMMQRPTKTTEVKVEAAAVTPVLVAAADIPLGKSIEPSDLRWLDWPQSSIPVGVIRKDQAPQAESELVGQLARQPMVASEPLRREKLIKTDGTGFLSAVLPSGMRAVAIATERTGATTAGGFILPNDRVDVIQINRHDAGESGGSDKYSSETIIQNARVLAIGQNVQEKNGEKVVIGETATLELDARQAELVVQAQRAGSLALALRSLKDARETEARAEDLSLTIVRNGVASKSARP